ncbi:hypothetical protein MPOCJGCO_4330 [Methylobacterium trifolii]|uniref:Uncharacterized protein n=1 Tax=Methylobacterium trifolii TaxID=1003092 RepID=A0ABQ4U469_9HYPH|nr:hypothetical protein MPOCJGCO_4330 [Methylobacterium trifolii]
MIEPWRSERPDLRSGGNDCHTEDGLEAGW